MNNAHARAHNPTTFTLTRSQSSGPATTRHKSCLLKLTDGFDASITDPVAFLRYNVHDKEHCPHNRDVTVRYFFKVCFRLFVLAEEPIDCSKFHEASDSSPARMARHSSNRAFSSAARPPIPSAPQAHSHYQAPHPEWSTQPPIVAGQFPIESDRAIREWFCPNEVGRM
jgi:hypothetical protein